jgi:hypothetical protein
VISFQDAEAEAVMGAWGESPWDNDDASDWFHHFMAQTNIRSVLMQTIQQKFEGEPYGDFEAGGTYDQLDIIRAAISVFIMLGRVYIWPIEPEDDENGVNSYEKDLRIVLDRAREITAISKQEDRAFPVMDREITILERRLERLVNRAALNQETEWPWGMNC